MQVTPTRTRFNHNSLLYSMDGKERVDVDKLIEENKDWQESNFKTRK